MELERWRRGETVTKEEQINLLETDDSLLSLSTTQSMSSIASPGAPSPVARLAAGAAAVASVGAAAFTTPALVLNSEEWDKERAALYQQLDEKVRKCLFNLK